MTHFVQTGEIHTAFEQQGGGPPLLLMHGAEASRLMFSSLVPVLAPHFTVIAYDQRDCGETRGPEVGASLEDLADDACLLIEALGWGRVHVLGSSFGGRVAQALALRHPQCVDKLVLASTWPLPEAYEAVCADAPRLAELRRQLPQTAAELAGWFFPEAYLQQRPELRSIFAAAKPESPRSVRRTATVESSMNAELCAISASVLLVAGELDRVVPPAVTLSMAERLRDAQIALLPGIGHATALQAPDLLVRCLVPFLSGVPLDKE